MKREGIPLSSSSSRTPPTAQAVEHPQTQASVELAGVAGVHAVGEDVCGRLGEDRDRDQPREQRRLVLVVALDERVDEHAERERRHETDAGRLRRSSPTMPARPQRIGRSSPATRRQGTVAGRTGSASSWRDRAAVRWWITAQALSLRRSGPGWAACRAGPGPPTSEAGLLLLLALLDVLLGLFLCHRCHLPSRHQNGLRGPSRS